MNASLGRRVAAEAIGTALLVTVVVGSGIQATELSHDVGVQLLANSLATVFGLGLLILLLGPVSGAHFNPAVTLAAWFTGRRDPAGLPLRDVAAYVPAQITGAIGGAILADTMFAEPLVTFSSHDRTAGHLLLSEVVATAGLILLIFGLSRIGRASLAPAAVASYIGAAYWFTSSTSFVNPAVTIGRAFTGTGEFRPENAASPVNLASLNQASPVNGTKSKSAWPVNVAPSNRARPSCGRPEVGSRRARRSSQMGVSVKGVPRWSISVPGDSEARYRRRLRRWR